MKILVLDIETTPHVVYDYELWGDRYTRPERLIQPTRTLCLCAKWVGEDKIYKLWGATMHARLWDLMNKADAVVTFNGAVFDILHINRGFAELGFGPPSPYVHIDLRRVVKRRFKFAYSSLDYVCGALGLDRKAKSPGMALFVAAMNGDEAAMLEILEYCAQDVLITEELYLALLPWIDNHPNGQLIDGNEDLCPKCSKPDWRVRQGVRHTLTRSYPRFSCRHCHAWFRGTRSVSSVDVRDVA